MVNLLTSIKTLEPFLINFNAQFHLAAITKQTNIPHPTARLLLNSLEEEGVLNKEYKGRLTLYSLNKSYPNLVNILTIAEKIKIIEKSKNELLLRELIVFFNESQQESAKIIIFGSGVQSIKQANDIDILFIGKPEQQKIKEFSKKINKEIHLIILKSLNNVSTALKKEICKKHLILQGSEEVIQWMLKE